MENSKIINFLQCLSKHELREFGKFVRSPFHNNRKDVIKYFDILKNHYPDFKEKEISKENLYDKLYPGKKYDSNSIVLLNSYLYNLGREYLAVSNLKEDKFSHSYHFLKNLDKHFADGLFEKEYKNVLGILNEGKLNNEFFGQKSMFEELEISFKLKRNRQDKVYQNTINYGDYLIYSFIVKLVITYHDMLVDKYSFNYDFGDFSIITFVKNFDFESFVKKMKTENTEHSNYLMYYYYLFMCNYYPDDEHYYSKLKECMFRDFDSLSMAEKSARFHYIIDYCLWQLKWGNSDFLREAFNLFVAGLEKKLYQSDTKDADIGLIFFRNLVIIGLAAKEHDFVEKFINEYGKEIKGEMREDTLSLSYAMLYYERKEYDRALECLNKVSSAFGLFKLSTKHILIKIYYETNQYDSFLSLLDAYKHYLKNEKIITTLIKDYHTNFLNYLASLIKIKNSGLSDDLFVLKNEIKRNMNMDYRHKLWLIEKAEELEKINEPVN